MNVELLHVVLSGADGARVEAFDDCTRQSTVALRNRLNAGEIHIWTQTTETLSDRDVGEALAILSPQEMDQCRRFVFEPDRRDYAIAHALIRRALSIYVNSAPQDLEFQTAPAGKPFLKQDGGFPSVLFNLSHTRGLALCAISGLSHIGVDAEWHRPTIDESFLLTVLSENEFAYVNGAPSTSDRVKRMTRLWTLKEAFTKATGEGLVGNLDRIAFDCRGNAVIFQPVGRTDVNLWQFVSWEPTSRHCAGLAIWRHGCC